MENTPLPPEDKVPRRKRFIVNFAYFLILFGLSILFVRYALPYLWAFVIAFIVVRLLRKPALAIHKHWKVDYKTASVILVLLFYATIGVAVIFLGILAVQKLGGWIGNWPKILTESVIPGAKTVLEDVDAWFEKINGFLNIDLDLNLESSITSALSSLTGLLTDLSKNLISQTTNIALSFSSVIINIFVCIVSTAFGLMDYNTIKFWFVDQLPPERSKFWGNVVVHLGKLLGKYILSYGLILLITYAELAAGLGIILRDEKAFIYAAVIAVFDILPIIGSGLFLFPWAVISMFTGSIGRGIGLLVLWCIISIVRNVIEPRIVGKSVGIHPLVTLFAMIAGRFIYGGIGIVLCPVTVALIHTLNSAGVLHLYNVPKQKEEPERTKLGRLVSSPFEWLADKIGKGFSWLFRLIFRKKPHSISEDMDELKAAKEQTFDTEISDEYISGSPEASGSGPRQGAPVPAEPKPKKAKKNKK